MLSTLLKILLNVGEKGRGEFKESLGRFMETYAKYLNSCFKEQEQKLKKEW